MFLLIILESNQESRILLGFYCVVRFKSCCLKIILMPDIDSTIQISRQLRTQNNFISCPEI